MRYTREMISFAVFLFGLAIGSFLNAFIYRLEVQQKLRPIPHGRKKASITVMSGRSFCPSCSHTLAWYDLIPLLSYILLKGRCRYCKAKISFQYPLVELATGILFVLVLLKLGLVFSVLELFYLWAIASFLMVIFVYDLKHFLIPDKVLYPATLVAGLWYVVSSMAGWIPMYQILNTIYSAVGAAGFFLAIFLVSRGRAIGFGDVKLALFMGLFLGFPAILVALAIAFASGALVGLALIFLKKKTMRSEVPFGPFLIVGTFVALFWGEPLVNFYMNLIL